MARCRWHERTRTGEKLQAHGGMTPRLHAGQAGISRFVDLFDPGKTLSSSSAADTKAVAAMRNLKGGRVAAVLAYSAFLERDWVPVDDFTRASPALRENEKVVEQVAVEFAAAFRFGENAFFDDSSWTEEACWRRQVEASVLSTGKFEVVGQVGQFLFVVSSTNRFVDYAVGGFGY